MAEIMFERMLNVPQSTIEYECRRKKEKKKKLY